MHNPCFVCHTKPRRPNFVDDSGSQLSYQFADDPRKNPWENLFKDRREAVGRISDEDIKEYVSTSNYFDAAGKIKLVAILNEVPSGWDYDGNRRWDGFVPDAWLNFDNEGFDRDPRGNPTGWRAFGYYPLPGTFWPTNGSTDDVLVRLPAPFRTDSDGRPNLTVCKTNLAVVEAMLKERDISIEPVDEKSLGGIDLDKNGKIGIASKIAYDWAPLEDRFM